jgi:hypothetical protein
MIRPPSTMSTKLKAKRRCCSSFFITDILGNHNRPPSPISPHIHKNHLTSNIIKDAESGDDDDTLLHDSDDNGKNN